MAQVTTGRRDAAADANAQAEALMALGRHQHALATIARGLILAPRDAGLHCQRASALLRQGRYRGALQAAGDAIAADPFDPRAHRLKAAALAAQARARMRLWRRHFGVQAQTAARRAVRLAPGDPRCHCTAAEAELLAGDWPAASAAAAQAISLAPDRPETYVALSRVALAARDFVTARAAADQALAINPRHYPAMVDRGAALVGLVHWKAAADTFAAAARLDAGALPAPRRLARLGGMMVGLALACGLLALLPLLALPLGVAVLGMVGLAAAVAAAFILSGRLRAAWREVGLRVGLGLARTEVAGWVLGALVVAGVAAGLCFGLVATAGWAVAIPVLGSVTASVGLVAGGAALLRSVRRVVGRRRPCGVGPSLVPVPPRPMAGVRNSLVVITAGLGWLAAARLVLSAPGHRIAAVAPALVAVWFSTVVGRRVAAAVARRRAGIDLA